MIEVYKFEGNNEEECRVNCLDELDVYNNEIITKEYNEEDKYVLEVIKKQDIENYIQDYIKKLEQRVKELMGTQVVDENRLAQEIVIFSDKSSIEEELTRLKSHINQFKNFLNGDSPIGKKLDFLIQEMNREVNTIGSKANSLDITNRVIEIKTEIENIREQVQNIE